MQDNIPHKRVLDIITKIKKVLRRARRFGDEEMLERIKSWEARLEEMKLTANKSAPPKENSKLPAPLRKALKEMADESYVAVVLGELAEAAEAMSAEAIERDEDEDEEDVIPYELDWASGVEHFQDKTPKQMWTHLGLEDRIPGLNDMQDPNGLVDPWMPAAWDRLVEANKVVPLFPFWHQVVGIAQLMNQVIHGRPTLLMDGVGVGKTLQLVGTIALYAQYYEFFKQNKCFPGAYCTSFLFFQLASH